jgi:hypothetical protein
MFNLLRRKWTLVGWDTFEGREYHIGTFATERGTKSAARRRLRKLERTQPSHISGGQRGIQDQVFVISPSGKRGRYVG